MMDKISIAMPYYNRRVELERSMRAYERLYDDIHLSICDDRSYPSLVVPETWLDVTASRIHSKDKIPKNPCVPMNMAVNQSKGDVIVLTSPEVEHIEPIFAEMLKDLGPMSYVTAGCVEPSGKCLVPRKRRVKLPEGAGFHFCSMLSRELWDLAGGFDENYRDGQAMEDVDWIFMLAEVGAHFVLRDDLTVVHHPTNTRWNGGHGKNDDYFRKKWGKSSLR